MENYLTLEHLRTIHDLKALPLEQMQLDAKLERLIVLFNQLPGIATRYSCSAHPPEKTQGYILFYVQNLEEAHTALTEIVWAAFEELHKDEPHSHHQLELRTAPVQFIGLEDKEEEGRWFPTLSLEFVVYDEIMQDEYLHAIATSVERYLENHKA